MRVLIRPSVIEGEVWAPPSKSYTHRAFAASLLAEGASYIERPLNSKDTMATLRACEMLGAGVIEEEAAVEITGGEFKLPEDVIQVENSGTTLRFFTAISSLAPPGWVVLTGDKSIRRRPMQPLLDALKRLGVESWSARGDGCAPIIVKSGGLKGGATRIRGDISSQFISAIIFASVRAEEDVVLWVEGRPVSKPYIDASIEVLNRFGFKVRRRGYTLFEIEGNQVGKPTRFRVPGDFGSASFILAAAHLTEGAVIVRELDPDFPQADKKILEVLRRFGSRVRVMRNGVKLLGGGEGGGGEFTLTDSPDLLPVVAVLAAKSREETLIRGAEHARLKESDRIETTATELRKLGVKVEVLKDGLRIIGKERLEGGVELDSHQDHRLFMALAALAASTERGCIINGAEWAAISYPQFLRHMKSLGAVVEEV